MVRSINLKVGQNHTISQLIKELLDFGYSNVDQLQLSSEFVVNGGLVQIFPVNCLGPVTLEFFGDQIDRIFRVDMVSSKKIDDLRTIEILANQLFLVDKSSASSSDYLVHEDHGVGIFDRIETLHVVSEDISYVVLNYLNNDVLRVPFSQIIKLSRYIGIGKRRPRLSKLGTDTWKKTYKKTYDDVIQMAKELLQVYAKREVILRPKLTFHSDWNNILASNFGFTETKDQADALLSVFQDIQKKSPMDRLICGDVGFGKTEIALRACAQFVANGYQVAFLVPTTILAEQHFATLQERFKSLPVRIDRLSRFVTEPDSKKVAKDVLEGKIDILIGTHKLLKSGLKFKNLGLAVIDEEQKFGVKDKEKLKNIKNDIDILTLTATPIPRTLFMALSGIRDISLISSVPVGRQAVDTRVIKYDENEVFHAISREIENNGQVYYLHNKVKNIQGIARKLRDAFPSLVVEVAHGQMGEIKLAKTMSDFSLGKINILVCSTIIENGLDLPNVNTLIVDEADHFGLSQLYQIRGRIGRSKKKSHAILTYSAKNITENAVKRLKVLVDNSELGTGYNIALHDLEIRGGGNILGRDQHGNMEAIGLVLYSKMLNMAVERLKK